MVPAEASAPRVEGEAGAQERVDVFDGGLWQVGGRFADAERAKVELFRRIGHDAEYQVVAVDLRIDPAPFRVLGHQFRHVGFAGQGGMAILSRYPTPAEVKNIKAYGLVQPGKPVQGTNAPKGAAPTVVVQRRDDWVDITWSLINSTEFLYRH